MRLSLFGLIRLTVMAAVASCAVAVGVARLQPSLSRYRTLVPPHYGVINGFVMTDGPSAPELLDSRTGQVLLCPLPAGDTFDFGTCSPWQDESGECQVVGRWMRLEGDGAREQCVGVGLARYALPSGRVLNRCSMDVVPVSHPCWFPGTAARVLFAAGDGVLYRFDFPDGPDGPAEDDGASAPKPLAWRCPRPGSYVEIRDPVWPTDPRLNRRLIVSLSIDDRPRSDLVQPAKLWWLELNDDASAIVAAGPLALGPKKIPSDDQEERFPNLAGTPDGSLVLTYLSRSQRSVNGSLRVARLTTESASREDGKAPAGAPSLIPGTIRTLTTNQKPELSPLSTDGRWVFGLVGEQGRLPRVVRYSTATEVVQKARVTPGQARASTARDF